MLDFNGHVEAQPVCFDQTLLQRNYTAEPEVITLLRSEPSYGPERRQSVGGFTVPSVTPLRIGLIDGYRFSQECLTKAFGDLQPRLTVLAFSNLITHLAQPNLL